ncbi:GNAT family N-acetyltransferase [Alteromonas confluentis]|uniref:GNAT family N-acetyltransferase n=1 Tax=Alteromonas confluentis TaxID=1656094 RepID=A0A1E7ZAK4_9ALTE|nr:GNAT family N-acetyltransferase [Alteromonas confluentis]OFC70559.1 GNAT family N-acetyltransferase [Alteromonas confluentis]
MEISQEKVVSRDIIALLEEHLADMHATSPPESVHALDVNALQAKDICFFTARENGVLLGCVAVKQLSASDAELKSMRTSHAARNRGVGAALLNAALAFCKQQKYSSLSLETGTQDYFSAAHRLYHRHGFSDCGPFGNYHDDPHSRFMTIAIA